MTDGSERLEHLFARVLDGEATPDECELLDALLRADAGVRQAYGDYRRLDLAFAAALRSELGRPVVRGVRRGVSWRLGRTAVLAAAAGLALTIWLTPPRSARTPGRVGQPAQASSWFLPEQGGRDEIEAVPATYVRPALEVQGTQRQWLVIPGDEPGRYMVIEVDRVRTHQIAVQQDF